MAFDLVTTVNVTASGGVTQLEFANIPSTGKDLLIVFSVRDRVGNDTAEIRLNDFTFGYNYRWMRNSGAGGAQSSGSQNYLDSTMVPSTHTANTFGNAQLYIANYTSAADKTIMWESAIPNNSTTWLGIAASMRWAQAPAVSNFKFVHPTTNGIAQFSKASLYIIS